MTKKSIISQENITFIDAVVTSVEVKYDNFPSISWATGFTVSRTLTSKTIRSMSVQDCATLKTIENLPAAKNCKPGDKVKITFELITKKGPNQ